MVIGIIAHSAAVTLVRLSLLGLYIRVFTTKTFKWTTIGLGYLCLLWFLIAVLAEILQCSPVSAAFHLDSLMPDQCIDLQACHLGFAISNLMLDVVVVTYPLPVIWSLQLDRQQKIVLTAFFSFGNLSVLFIS